MKLLLFSDAHRNDACFKKLMSLANELIKPDMMLYAGDGSVYFDAAEYVCTRFMVRGNCDFGSPLPDELLIPCAGHLIYLCHGHLHKVKHGLEPLAREAAAREADIAVYGHTHKQGYELVNRVHCINPGALTTGEYAVLRFEGKQFFPEFRRLRDL